MKKESLGQLLITVKKALTAGGAVVRRGFHKPTQVRYKGVADPFTQIDLASEKAVFGVISKAFPSHAFLAEESAFQKGQALSKSRPDQYRWIVDPLDGTVNFIHRIPQSCVSVAVECGGVLLAGGVFDPFRDEMFLAAKGQGATLNGRKIRVSLERKPLRSLVVTGFPYQHQKEPRKHALFIAPFLEKFADLRRLGAAALDLSWIACGRVDAYFEFGLKPWDVAAGALLVSEAGGKVTNFRGKPMNIDDSAQTAATNGLLHSQVVRILNGNLTES